MRPHSAVFKCTLAVVSILPVISHADVRPERNLVPVVFEKNGGQVPSPYRFVSHNGGVAALFLDKGIDLNVRARDAQPGKIQLRFLEASEVIPQGRKRLATTTNYLIGNDRSRWLTRLENYAEVVYSGLYPAIDLVFRGSQNQIEHDFHVEPHGDPKMVHFTVEGAADPQLDANGNLEIALPEGTLLLKKPRAYQVLADGRERSVDCAFILADDRSVRFQLGAYDANRELVIDPVFGFSTYLDGSNSDHITGVAADSSGNIYVTGYTYSLDFPIVNGVQPTYQGSPDAFVAKLDPTGHALLYSTYLGGSSSNYGNSIAVDAKGNIIVEGTSSSNDFPHAGNVPPLTIQGNDCFFIASLKPDGSGFNYAGLIGGTEGTDVQTGSSGSGVVTVTSSGAVYLAGVTDDANFEITPGTLSSTVPGYPYNSSFVMEVDHTGALVYSTIIPGTLPLSPINYVNVFIPNGIAVDGNGRATIAGTAGPGLPSTPGVIQPTFPNNLNNGHLTAGFVLQLNATASAISYATYVRGTDSIGGLALDGQANSYVAGGTSETNLPVSSNAYQKTLKAGPNCTCNSGFILKLNSNGTSVLAATYLEGTPAIGNEGTNFTGIALDNKSNVFVGGTTGSTDFPLQNPFTSLWQFTSSSVDMALAEMNPDLSKLLLGSFLSSNDPTFGGTQFSSLTVDAGGNLVVAGQTNASDFPTTTGSFQPTPPVPNTYHAVVAKLDMSVPAPSVCFASWSLNFGQVRAKTSATQTLHLANCGNATLHLQSIVSSAATITTGSSCATVNAGTSCVLSVKFAPRDSSLTSATLTFSDDTVISPQVISVSGQGVAPQLSPSTGSDSFGHVLVNTVGAGNSLFFGNAGNAPLQITAVSVDGDFSITQDGCKGTLQPNGGCLVTITFSPTAAGIRTGTLMISSNDPVYPKAGISLNGIGDTVYPVPLITSLGAPTVQINNGSITVQVYGANFYPASVLEVNGKSQGTTYLNAGEIQATLDSTVASKIGEISLRVVNPAPGGGTSVSVPLTLYEVLNVDAAFITPVPGSSLLYASIPSSAAVYPNTVISINPTTGALGKPITVGQNPSLLAPSSDGSYLFVVSNQDQTVQRINLSTKSIDRTFPFPPNGTTCCGTLSGFDLKGLPGSPQEVVLAADIGGYGFGEMALYNDSGLVNYVPNPQPTNPPAFWSFAYAGNPLTIYALPFTGVQNGFFSIVTIGAQGLGYTPASGTNTGGNQTGSVVVSDGALLYTGGGEVWNPATQTQVGSFPVTVYNYAANLAMDTTSGHIFAIGDEPYGNSASNVLSAYDKSSLALTGALAFPQIQLPLVQNLVRWGSNGFAFLAAQPPSGNTEAVYLLTSSLAKSVTSNPVPKVHSIAPSSAPQDSLGFQMTINGSGFTEASVVNWNGVPLQTTFTSTTALAAAVPATNLSASGNVSITITNPAPGGGTSNEAQFNVAPLTPLISFSSSTLSFSNQKVGTASAAKVIAVQNPGTAPLNISSVRIIGTDASSFHQTNNCGTVLAPGGNCSLSVVFKPTSTGVLSASISFADNAAGSPQAISIAGTGN